MAKVTKLQTPTNDETANTQAGIMLETINWHGTAFVKPYGSVKRLDRKEHPGIAMYWMPDHILVKTAAGEFMFDHSSSNGCLKAK